MKEKETKEAELTWNIIDNDIMELTWNAMKNDEQE